MQTLNKWLGLTSQDRDRKPTDIFTVQFTRWQLVELHDALKRRRGAIWQATQGERYERSDLMAVDAMLHDIETLLDIDTVKIWS